MVKPSKVGEQWKKIRKVTKGFFCKNLRTKAQTPRAGHRKTE